MLSDEERLTVVNVVASTRVAEELDLPDIAIQLNCEYEPEQFPGVVYRVVDPKLLQKKIAGGFPIQNIYRKGVRGS